MAITFANIPFASSSSTSSGGGPVTADVVMLNGAYGTGDNAGWEIGKYSNLAWLETDLTDKYLYIAFPATAVGNIINSVYLNGELYGDDTKTVQLQIKVFKRTIPADAYQTTEQIGDTITISFTASDPTFELQLRDDNTLIDLDYTQAANDLLYIEVKGSTTGGLVYGDIELWSAVFNITQS
jgi:hypothetical protein